jgi:hypothetical protein
MIRKELFRRRTFHAWAGTPEAWTTNERVPALACCAGDCCGCSTVGALTWIVCEIWLGHVTGPWIALTVSTAAYLGAGLVAVAMAGTARTRVRTMAAMVMVGQHDPVSVATRDKLEALAGALMEADERLMRGQLSPAEHELTWWRVYDRMEPGRTISAA